MGLDAVELVMAVEEEFGIVIADSEVTDCTTPGLLIDLVMRKLPQGGDPACASQRAFHLLRRALVRTTTLKHEEIRLGTELPMPEDGAARVAFWSRLRSEVGARSWPDPVRPRSLFAVMSISTVAAFFGGLLLMMNDALARTLDRIPYLHQDDLGPAALLLGAAVAVFIGKFLARITRRFRTLLPRGARTVGGLVPYAMTSDSVAWSRDEVAKKVRTLVIEQLGLKDEHYSEDADFIRELGMD